MATIVHVLWLAAERALFSCNDQALWYFFSARRLFWVLSKTYERMGENNRKYGQSSTLCSITEKKLTYGYWYFFSMSDEESHSTRKRIRKISSGVFIVFLNGTKRPYNKYLLTLSFGHYREISDLGLDVLTSLSLGQYIKASVWDFPVMTSLSVNK